jgi:hypothetical protein
MNIMENFYIYLYHKHNILVEEQTPTEENPLFKIITPTPPTHIIMQTPTANTFS